MPTINTNNNTINNNNNNFTFVTITTFRNHKREKLNIRLTPTTAHEVGCLCSAFMSSPSDYISLASMTERVYNSRISHKDLQDFVACICENKGALSLKRGRIHFNALMKKEPEGTCLYELLEDFVEALSNKIWTKEFGDEEIEYYD